MKNIFAILIAIFSLTTISFAQSDIKMRTEYGSENADLLSVLRFEEIGLSKMLFTGADLKGKDYQITIKEYVKGKLTKQEVVFDSKESDYFKIKSDKFSFRIMTKTTSDNLVRFSFQFNGFSKKVEYKIAPGQREFAQKDFLGAEIETPITVGTEKYILTYMMPYDKKDGTKQYCEVAQSGVNPEEFGLKYALPRYYLIDIKFH